MSDIEITAKQYKDLKITYSEKNNVDNIIGGEHRVIGQQVVNFNIQPSSIISSTGEMTINYHEYNSNYDYYPIDNINLTPISFGMIVGSFNNLKIDRDCVRVEDYTVKGTLTAYTDRAITNLDDISASATLYYNSYHKQTTNLQEENPIMPYYQWTKPAFEPIRQTQYADKENNTITEYSTDTALPYNDASMTSALWGLFADVRTVPAFRKPQIYFSKPRIISENGATIVEFDYEITIWTAYNTLFYREMIFFSPGYEANYYMSKVNRIQFSVQANTVETVETNFAYNNGNKQKEYDLEDNNLMQYEFGQPLNQRQSYTTSQKILEKTSINRLVVSFDLLDCLPVIEEVLPEMVYARTKDTVVDPTKDYYIYNKDTGEFTLATPDFNTNTFYYEYTNATRKRFLKAGDLIKIKDQNDHYVGQYYNTQGELVTPDFEVVTYHGKWDGAFHVEMICKQAVPEEDEEEE